MNSNVSNNEIRIQRYQETLQTKAEKWNKNLKSQMHKKGFTQKGLADEINNLYGTAFNQKSAYLWLHVGHNNNSFPKADTMIMIASCLNVDLGFLLGETEEERFDEEKAVEYLDIDVDLVRKIKRGSKYIDHGTLAFLDSIFQESFLNSLERLFLDSRLKELADKSLAVEEEVLKNEFRTMPLLLDKLAKRENDREIRTHIENGEWPSPRKATSGSGESLDSILGAAKSVDFANRLLMYERQSVIMKLNEFIEKAIEESLLNESDKH